MKGSLLIAVVVAMAVGVAGGLVYAWVLDAPEGYDSSPDSLLAEDKLVYLALIGDLYAHEQDLARAEARLAELDVEADGLVLAEFIERHLTEVGRPEDVRNLARLAEALGASGGVLMVFQSEPTPTAQPTPTSSPGSVGPSAPAPTLTPAPRFELLEQTATCADPGQPGRIAVWVRDASGTELPGVEIIVTWAADEDRLFTGLYPDKGPGYADFEMTAGTEYEVALAQFGGDVARRLAADLAQGLCPTGTVALDWRLTFQEAP